MAINRSIALIGLCVLFTGCSTSGYYNNNPQQMKLGNNPHDMGVRYLLGRGAEQNDTKAFSYFSQAAEQGNALAQSELAYLYAAGKGTNQDYAQAFHWYQKAAEQDLAGAEYNLGLLYLHGLGTQPNQTLAMQWIKKSAAHGFEPARTTLAQYRS